MNREAFAAILQECHERLGAVEPRRWPTSSAAPDQKGQRQHIAWMLQELEKDTAGEWSDEKLCRWLGFIQGVLWGGLRLYSVDDMREQNARL